MHGNLRWLHEWLRMDFVKDILPCIKTITFDCYGTLIDWKGGLEQSFRTMFGSMVDGRMDELFDVYVQVEAEVESGSYRSYDEVLSEVSLRLADRLGFELTPEKHDTLSTMLPSWPAFVDTNNALVRLKKRFQLGVLSNIDRDMFAGTATLFDVSFDFLVTAEDVGSYKPALGHFQKMLDQHGQRDSVLHVAQSLYHDGIPAGELGLAFVWINRYKQTNETTVQPTAEFSDLKSLADVVCQ